MTLEQFTKETNLLPHIVAETVFNQRRAAADYRDSFIDYAEKKTLICYEVDKTFQRGLRSHIAREYYYSFVNHWLDSFMAAVKRGGQKQQRLFASVGL